MLYLICKIINILIKYFTAAGMTIRSLFLTQKRGNISDTFWMHYIFADGSGSDLIAIYRVYRVSVIQNLIRIK